jgi:hypothetical protein
MRSHGAAPDAGTIRHVRVTLILGLVGVVAFVLAHPLMWGLGGPVQLPGWDLTRVFWADLAFASQAVRAGELPLWNPLDRAGYPFMAEPQSGMFDPVTWVLVLLALVLGSAPAWLMTVKVVTYYGIAASGVAMFLRERLARQRAQATTWAVTVGVLAFVLSPRMDKLKDQSALWPTAWIGWLLVAVDRCMRRPSPRRGLWLGAAASMTVISGYPPGAFRLALLAIPYAIALAVQEIRSADDWRGYLREVGRAGAAAVLVLAVLTAGQIWSTLQVLPGTERAALELGDILASRTRPAHAAGIFAPAIEITPLMMYVGFACALGLLASLWRSSAEDFVLVLVGGFGFLLACGEHATVLPRLAKLPGFSSFRIAGHYLVLPVTVLALVGPIGLARLAERTRLMPRWPPLVVVTAGVVAFFVFTPPRGTLGVLAVLATALLVLAVAFAESRAHKRRAGWALVPVVALDLFLASRPTAEILKPLPDAARGRTLAEAIERSPYFRVADFGWAGHRVGPRENVRDLAGHRPALTDRRYTMLYDAAPTWVSLLQGANVSVVGYSKRAPSPKGARLEPLPHARGLYRVPDPWPLAFWTRDVAVVPSPEFSLAWLQARRSPGAAVEKGTIDDETAERLRAIADVGADPVAPRLLEQSLHRLVFEIDAPSDGLFVVLEGHAPGWHATVDDDPAAVLRVNLIFRGVEVPAGTHRVTLSYNPAGVRALWWLWAFGIAGLGVLAVDELRRRRSPRETECKGAEGGP